MRRGFPIFWFVFCSAAAGFGIYLAANQHWKLARFLPVEATVQNAEVETRRRRSSERTRITYLPAVHYQYNVNGITYESKSVFPMDVGRGSRWGRRWAKGIVNEFKTKHRTGAFYDPLDPTQAFLRKQPSVFPYFFILVPTILGIVGLVGFTATNGPLPKPVKRRRALHLAATWHGVGFLAAGHYFTLAGSDYDSFALPLFGGYTFLGLIPILFSLPPEGLGGRLKASGTASLIGGFLGFWLGLCSGWLAAFFTDRQHGGPSWIMYGVMIGAGLLAILGLFVRDAEPS